MHLDLHLALLAVLTLAVGYLMTFVGVQKSALEWRRPRRICPSCGRLLESRVCETCSG
jgi:hypothetical protein